MIKKVIALIYTRVSSTTQETYGSGNDSQETRCRERAKTMGWEIGEVFRDTFTGAGDFMDRPEMRRLLEYIGSNKGTEFVLIFDDIKRLSRDTEAFIKLVALLKTLGVRIECLNHKFDDSPEGEFIATILAAQGQLERKQNKRQVAQKIEAHLINGDWPSKAPYGYKRIAVSGNKLSLSVIDGDIGNGIKDGLKSFAYGGFRSKSEFGRYLSENNYIKNVTRNGLCDKATRILTNPFNAGYIHKPEKNILMVKGKHEAMITLEEFYLIQKRLKREDEGEREYLLYRDDFELRQLVRCTGCGNKLRSAKSKGRSKYYYYYICRTKDCENECVHLEASELHEHLYKTLREIESKSEVIDIGIQAFNEAFEEVVKSKGLVAGEIESSISIIDNQIDTLVSNLTKLTNESAVRGIEAKIEELDLERKILRDKKEKIGDLDNKSRTALSEMKEFLKSPYQTWKMCDARQQRSLYRFIFAEDFFYDPKSERRTISLSPLYAYFQGLNENTPLEKECISDDCINCALGRNRTCIASTANLNSIH